MWRQVTGERARERTKEDFAAEMRTRDEFLEFAAAWWPVLDAATVLGWLRDPELLARVGEGVLDDESVRLLSKSWGPSTTTGALRRRRGPARRAALPARRPADREHRLGRRRIPRCSRTPRCRSSAPPPTGSTPARAAGPRRPTGSRTTRSRTCSSTRRRTSRRCSGGWSDDGAAWPPGRSSATSAQSSWPVPEESAGPRGGAGRQAASRLPPLDELPQLLGDLRLRGRLRRPGRSRCRPARCGPVDRGRPGGAPGRRPRAGGARRRSASWPGRWRARSVSWSRRRATAR